MLLEHLKPQAINAHQGTSFSPEKRGEQMIKDYSEQLASDIADIEAMGLKAGFNTTEQVDRYKKNFEEKLSAWMGAKSRIYSTMITGPANFPVRQMEKRNRSERNRYEEFVDWRSRALVAISKVIKRSNAPEKTMESELERYRSELAKLEQNHELMKEGNKRIAKAKKTGEDITGYLAETFNIQPHMMEFTLKFGFGLQNSNANIKRVKERIELLTRKEEAKATTGNTEVAWPDKEATIIINREIDRVQIKFPGTPPFELRKDMKSNGFKWAPSQDAWQRQLTANALSAVRRLTGVSI